MEDVLLKQNVPGQYSNWGRGDDQRGPDARADDLDDSDCESGTEKDPPMQFGRAGSECHNVPHCVEVNGARRCPPHRTGVKGVLADHANLQAEKMAEHQLMAEYREAKLQQMAYGAPRTPADGSAPSRQGGPDDPNPADSNDSLDDDEEAVHMYRKMRLVEMMPRKGLIFGEVVHATRTTFVEEVDCVHPDTFVVVHLYEPYLKLCEVLNRTFATLAKKYNGVKFVSIRSTDGDKDFDPIALPTVNIYKDKAIITCLTRVGVYVCNEDITKHIEGLLAEYEVFGLSQ